MAWSGGQARSPHLSNDWISLQDSSLNRELIQFFLVIGGEGLTIRKIWFLSLIWSILGWSFHCLLPVSFVQYRVIFCAYLRNDLLFSPHFLSYIWLIPIGDFYLAVPYIMRWWEETPLSFFVFVGLLHFLARWLFETGTAYFWLVTTKKEKKTQSKLSHSSL